MKEWGAPEFKFGAKKGLIEETCLGMATRNLPGKDQGQSLGHRDSK